MICISATIACRWCAMRCCAGVSDAASAGASTPDPDQEAPPPGPPPRALPLEPFILVGEQEGPTVAVQQPYRPLLFPHQRTDCKGPRPLLGSRGKAPVGAEPHRLWQAAIDSDQM